MEFKLKLIYARAKLNMSQTDLAKSLGVSFQTINRWENGKVTPTKKAEIQFDEFCQNNNVIFKGSASSEK